MIATDRSRAPFQVGVFSVVKHDYLPRAIAAHPRFELKCVADNDDRPDWTHERNQLFADESKRLALAVSTTQGVQAR